MQIEDLWLIGIGMGSPAHVTLEGMEALRNAAVLLVPQKGPGKEDLAYLRDRIIASSGSKAQVIAFDYPKRDESLPYATRVELWHDEIALRWQQAMGQVAGSGPVALLVWGDPSLYDSTLRIAARLRPAPRLRVVPGITAVQALTAAHGIPLNEINGPVMLTTGRRLAQDGWPLGIDRLVVMLDGETRFQALAPKGVTIWWGAYLGMPEQILDHGPLAEAGARIVETRRAARARHGWIMDTYLLCKAPND